VWFMFSNKLFSRFSKPEFRPEEVGPWPTKLSSFSIFRVLVGQLQAQHIFWGGPAQKKLSISPSGRNQKGSPWGRQSANRAARISKTPKKTLSWSFLVISDHFRVIRNFRYFDPNIAYLPEHQIRLSGVDTPKHTLDGACSIRFDDMGSI